MSRTTPRLLAAATLAASVMAASGAASAAADVGGAAERVAVVTLGDGRATVYSGDPAALPSTRTLRSGDRAALSPDARLVAYTRLATGRAEIHIASVSGMTDRLLARVRPYDIALAFSPDGRTLAYSSAAGITTVGLSGAGRHSLATPRVWRGSRYSSLAYTPDGRRLLASRTTGDGRAGTLRNELVALDMATGRGTTLYRSPNPYDQQARPASFSPDGSSVAVDGTGAIVLVPTASGAEQRLTAPPRNGSDVAPLISPDGARVAFARRPDRGVADVYVIGIDGTGLRRVTTTPIPPQGTPKVGSTPLSWAPDGRSLLTFRHDRFASIDLQTRASTDVRTVGVRYSVPAARWVGVAPLPARTGIVVFERCTDWGTADLYTVGADGMRLRRLTSGGLSFDPAWSPDGDRIAFTGGHVLDRELYSMNADGTGTLQLTSFLGSAWVRQPSWYRDATGLRILFTRQPARTPDGGDLYGIGSDGLTSIPLLETPDPEADGSLSADGRLAYELRGAVWIREAGATRRLGPGTQPQWSPDATRLVVVREPGLHGGTIGVVGAGGSGFRAVGFGTDPAWSPDGTTIVYGTQSGLFTTRADGAGQPRRLTHEPRLTLDLSPSWRTA